MNGSGTVLVADPVKELELSWAKTREVELDATLDETVLMFV